MIVKTLHSIYEVHEDKGRFRRIDGEWLPGAPPPGEWRSFDRMSPVVPDRPVRFFWLMETAGTSARFGTYATSPVVRVIPDEPALTAT